MHNEKLHKYNKKNKMTDIFSKRRDKVEEERREYEDAGVIFLFIHTVLAPIFLYDKFSKPLWFL
jgi:hypothetical protein